MGVLRDALSLCLNLFTICRHPQLHSAITRTPQFTLKSADSLTRDKGKANLTMRFTETLAQPLDNLPVVGV
jgi:hypothetical protein